MLHDDRIIFGLLLSKIYLRNKLDLDPEFNYLIRGQDLDPRDKVQAAIDSLRDRFAYFKDLNPSLSHDSDFAAWMTSPTPEDQVTQTFTKFVYIYWVCLHIFVAEIHNCMEDEEEEEDEIDRIQPITRRKDQPGNITQSKHKWKITQPIHSVEWILEKKFVKIPKFAHFSGFYPTI